MLNVKDPLAKKRKKKEKKEKKERKKDTKKDKKESKKDYVLTHLGQGGRRFVNGPNCHATSARTVLKRHQQTQLCAKRSINN